MPTVVPGPVHVERLLTALGRIVGMRRLPDRLAPRFAAIKLLERDACVRKLLEPHLIAADWDAIARHLAGFEAATEQRAEFVMSAVRHNLAFELFESVASVGRTPRAGVHEKLNDLLMHPVLGYVILVAVLAGTFVLGVQGRQRDRAVVPGLVRAASTAGCRRICRPRRSATSSCTGSWRAWAGGSASWSRTWCRSSWRSRCSRTPATCRGSRF